MWSGFRLFGTDFARITIRNAFPFLLVLNHFLAGVAWISYAAHFGEVNGCRPIRAMSGLIVLLSMSAPVPPESGTTLKVIPLCPYEGSSCHNADMLSSPVMSSASSARERRRRC
jgi:hypothetical protein